MTWQISYEYMPDEAIRGSVTSSSTVEYVHHYNAGDGVLQRIGRDALRVEPLGRHDLIPAVGGRRQPGLEATQHTGGGTSRAVALNGVVQGHLGQAHSRFAVANQSSATEGLCHPKHHQEHHPTVDLHDRSHSLLVA